MKIWHMILAIVAYVLATMGINLALGLTIGPVAQYVFIPVSFLGSCVLGVKLAARRYL